MGGYRQWQLPKIYKMPASKNPNQQKFRFVKTLDKWQKAIAEKKHVIVMMDTNVDTFNSKHNKTWNVENLKKKFI